MLKNEKNKQLGITLVALVITVIILLILAGVAMSLITGEGGLFARANHAADLYNKTAYNEAVRYDELDALMGQYIGDVDNGGGQTPNPTPTPSGLQDAVTETPTTFSVQANATNITLTILPAYVGTIGETTYEFYIGDGNDSTNGTWVSPRLSTDTSYTFTKLDATHDIVGTHTYTVNVKIGGTAQTSQSVTTASQANMKDISTVSDAIKYSATPILATDTSYSGIYKELTTTDGSVKVPVGFTVRYDSALTVDGGIVVADQNDNQWVWIPVNVSNPYTRTWYGTSGQDARLKTSATANEKVTIGSSSYYIYYEAEPISTDVDYNLASRVGGFYIGRFEAGSAEDTSAVTMRSAETIEKTVTLKKDQVPYNYVAINSDKVSASANGNIIDLCEDIATNNYKSGITTKLCSSYAWDTALNFIGNSSWSMGTGTDYQSIRQNYKSSATFKGKKISNGVIVEIDKTQNSSNGVMLTGQGDATKNIYDMGGNCYEYTTESCSYSFSPFVRRGGYCTNDFSDTPAGGRGYYDGIADEDITFRPTLYL